MDCAVIFLLLVIVFFISVVVGSSQRSQRKRKARIYRAVARRFGGRYVTSGPFARPGATLRYGQTHALVTEAVARGPFTGRCTQLSVAGLERRLEWELFSRSHLEEMPKDAPWPWLDRDFRDRFVLRGRGEHDLQSTLSEGTRWQIQRLDGLFDVPGIHVMAWRGQLVVQKPMCIARFDQLFEFTTAVFDLYDQIQLARSQGIEFLAQDRLQPLDEVSCRICGDSIDTDLVYCPRCKTPHHCECWEFTGFCSTYGCGESRYVRPRGGIRTDVR